MQPCFITLASCICLRFPCVLCLILRLVGLLGQIDGEHSSRPKLQGCTRSTRNFVLVHNVDQESLQPILPPSFHLRISHHSPSTILFTGNSISLSRRFCLISLKSRLLRLLITLIPCTTLQMLYVEAFWRRANRLSMFKTQWR